jgi:hypothetical protein
MTKKLWSGSNAEGKGRRVFRGIITMFARRDWGKLWKLESEWSIGTADLQHMSQAPFCLSLCSRNDFVKATGFQASLLTVIIKRALDISVCRRYFFPPMALQPLLGPGLFFSSVIIFYTDGSAPWTDDKPVARPLPTHSTTQTQYKRIHRYPCLDWDSNPRS